MKVRLYIGNTLADLQDDSLILFNYTMDDLNNPTIVKNSYSQQVTLPGTATNNTIFGDIFRLDRKQVYDAAGTGLSFDPSKRTSFEIRSVRDEILESGYLKLDKVTKKGNTQEYSITLYGGLGSFLYNLAYDSAGNKRTLADIDYLHTGNKDGELDFTINATFVQSCWTRLYNGPTTPAQIADVINFAPCYNGIPENFDANKGLIAATGNNGVQSTATVDGTVYNQKSGYTLVELPEEVTEWAAKDLRSYLQRPVLSIFAFLNALTYSDNCGGYTFDCSRILSSGTHDYQYLWMTLPLLPTLPSYRQEQHTITLTPDDVNYKSGDSYIPVTLGSTIPAGSKTTVVFNTRMSIYSAAASAASLNKIYFQRYTHTQSGLNDYYDQDISGFFVQLLAYDSSNNVVGGSKVVCIGDNQGVWKSLGSTFGIAKDTKTRADVMGYTPKYSEMEDVWGQYYATQATLSDGSLYHIDAEMSFELEAYDIASLRLCVTPYHWYEYITQHILGIKDIDSGHNLGSTAQYVTSAESQGWGNAQKYAYVYYRGRTGVKANTATYQTTDTLRSGAKITKAMLLSTDYSPADLLLSIAKTLGLSFLCDKGTKTVKLVFRNDLYQNEIVDINSRIDRSKNITINPLVFDTKWLTMEQENVEGAFAEEYEDLYGIPFGIQKIDTGYDFNAEATALMDSIVFKSAVTSLEYGKYYNYVTQVGSDSQAHFWPSPFLTTGCKQTLWSTAGATTEIEMTVPPSPVIDYFSVEDGESPGYDYAKDRKLQFHDADGGPVDGDNVLVFLNSWGNYDHFQLTDDSATMNNINGGVPCWWLSNSSGVAPSATLRIPIFSRYNDGEGYNIETSLDFGRVKELNSPSLAYKDLSHAITIYEKMWKKYLSDRYDVNTRVVTCYVDMRGMQVNEELLRKFYYFDNALWVLNKISNYSLTSIAPVECEFVKVQDKENYRRGQSYNFVPTNIYEVLDEQFNGSVISATKVRNKITIQGDMDESEDNGYGYVHIRILEDCQITLTASSEEDYDMGYIRKDGICESLEDVQGYADVYASGEGEATYNCNAGDEIYVGYTKDESEYNYDDNVEFYFTLT